MCCHQYWADATRTGPKVSKTTAQKPKTKCFPKTKYFMDRFPRKDRDVGRLRRGVFLSHCHKLQKTPRPRNPNGMEKFATIPDYASNPCVKTRKNLLRSCSQNQQAARPHPSLALQVLEHVSDFLSCFFGVIDGHMLTLLRTLLGVASDALAGINHGVIGNLEGFFGAVRGFYGNRL